MWKTACIVVGAIVGTVGTAGTVAEGSGVPIGACCMCDGSCMDLTIETCTEQDGAWQGEGTSCANVSCSQFCLGACCLGDGTCISLSEEECGQIEGTYMGIDTVCDDAACPSCPADLDGDGQVGVDDLVALVLAWGDCPPGGPCPPGDLNGDLTIDVDDLVALVLAWGTCPG